MELLNALWQMVWGPIYGLGLLFFYIGGLTVLTWICFFIIDMIGRTLTKLFGNEKA